jgi:DNA-binding MarR family transcriptional regulator
MRGGRVDDRGLRAEVGSLLVHFIARVVLHNQVVAQRLGLGASDSQFLSLLDVHGPLSPRQLVDLTGLSSGTVTGVLDRLESRGYVRRDRDDQDRRKVVVTPVADARARVAEQYADYGRHTMSVLERCTTRELRFLASFLTEMLEADEAETGEE